MHARRSCQFCARRKIRCSKELPTCASCRSHQRKCVYDKRALPEGFDGEGVNRHLIRSTAQGLSTPAARDTNRSSLRFLDHVMFVRSYPITLTDQFDSRPAPALVRTILGDSESIHDIALYYFRAASPWMPIISKRRVFDQLLNPLLSPIPADAYFLLLCMLVVTQPPPVAAGAWSDEYYAAIQFRAELDLTGSLSLNILQGCILLYVYEQGNAIYPAAHLSLGSCLQRATALGLGWTYAWPDPGPPAEQIRKEERRRVWWAIYLLERIQTLGNPSQVLLVPEPGLGAQLPWPEAEWDVCDIPTTPSTLSSPSSKVGRFSAIVQASYLLSNVYAHLSHSFTDQNLRQREVKQLHNTLSALMRYTLPESAAELRVMCYFRAIGTVAMIVLLEPYVHGGDDVAFLDYARSAMDDAITTTANSASAYVQRDTSESTPGAVSPFILPWLYISAKKCIQDNRQKSLVLIEAAITKFAGRWKAANAYADLLAAAKVMR